MIVGKNLSGDSSITSLCAANGKAYVLFARHYVACPRCNKWPDWVMCDEGERLKKRLDETRRALGYEPQDILPFNSMTPAQQLEVMG